MAKRFRACDQIQVDCHQKTRFEKIHMVAICTRYNSLPTEYNIDHPESEMTCRYSKSRAPGGFAAYDINPNEALAK